jgi:hypothetical protein
MIFNEFKANRKILLNYLKPEDRIYIIDVWKPKKDRVI